MPSVCHREDAGFIIIDLMVARGGSEPPTRGFSKLNDDQGGHHEKEEPCNDAEDCVLPTTLSDLIITQPEASLDDSIHFS